jgi:uncharacterized protein YcgI (DUF1989 family)
MSSTRRPHGQHESSRSGGRPQRELVGRAEPGQTLRIVDLEGKQAVDLCYNADDPADRYNAADTMKYKKNVYLGEGLSPSSPRASAKRKTVMGTPVVRLSILAWSI